MDLVIYKGAEMYLPIIVLGGLGLIFGLFLSIFEKKISIKKNPLLEKIERTLPQANCGACGYPSCNAYAQALFEGKDEPGKCIAGGEDLNQKVASLLNRKVAGFEKKVAIILCKGSSQKATLKYNYKGVKTCFAVSLVNNGDKDCNWGCLGYGDCVEICPFDAIYFNREAMPQVDSERCTGCGKCVDVCPRNIISLVPKYKGVHIFCKNQDKGVTVRKICSVGCIGCGICVRSCPHKAIVLENNVARIIYEKCTNCGICISKCPTKSIGIMLSKKEEDERSTLQLTG